LGAAVGIEAGKAIPVEVEVAFVSDAPFLNPFNISPWLKALYWWMLPLFFLFSHKVQL